MIRANWKFDHRYFEARELDVLNQVVEQLKNRTTKEVVDVSHDEAA